MEGDAGVPTLQQVHKGSPIENTDRYGKATIDYIHMGVDYFLQMTSMEYRVGSMTAFAPWASIFGRQGTIGGLGFTLFSAPLILTAIAGTSAVGSPNTFTAIKASIAPGFQSQLLFGPQLRTIPLKLILLPYTDSGNFPANFLMA